MSPSSVRLSRKAACVDGSFRLSLATPWVTSRSAWRSSAVTSSHIWRHIPFSSAGHGAALWFVFMR
jgi:hypothetical protein